MLTMECTLCRRHGKVDAIDHSGLRLVCAYCGGPAELVTAPQQVHGRYREQPGALRAPREDRVRRKRRP